MHEGHRKRMRDKFLKQGGDAFLTHEILEMVLFYALPRCNTNEIAHALIDKFGSFRGVLDAEMEELTEVKGIGDSAAMLIQLLSVTNRLYFQEPQDKVQRFETLSAAREFGISRFIGMPHEDIYALLLDNQLRKIECIRLGRGAVNHVPFDLTELYRHCLARKASAIILYHNHPRGFTTPSREDVEITYQIQGKLSDINVCLLEHFIISDFSSYPILCGKSGVAVPAIPKGGIDRSTLNRFYCN